MLCDISSDRHTDLAKVIEDVQASHLREAEGIALFYDQGYELPRLACIIGYGGYT